MVPLTLYNKYKGMCEPILLKHIDKKFEGVIFNQQRFDTPDKQSVNILTNMHCK